jgi:hypothetical protein
MSTTPTDAPPLLDRWGNTIIGGTSGIGPLGQYRIVSARDGSQGRTLRICGEAASDKHLLLWTFDAGERRYVCAICFPEAQGAR